MGTQAPQSLGEAHPSVKPTEPLVKGSLKPPTPLEPIHEASGYLKSRNPIDAPKTERGTLYESSRFSQELKHAAPFFESQRKNATLGLGLDLSSRPSKPWPLEQKGAPGSTPYPLGAVMPDWPYVGRSSGSPQESQGPAGPNADSSQPAKEPSSSNWDRYRNTENPLPKSPKVPKIETPDEPLDEQPMNADPSTPTTPETSNEYPREHRAPSSLQEDAGAGSAAETPVAGNSTKPPKSVQSKLPNNENKRPALSVNPGALNRSSPHMPGGIPELEGPLFDYSPVASRAPSMYSAVSTRPSSVRSRTSTRGVPSPASIALRLQLPSGRPTLLRNTTTPTIPEIETIVSTPGPATPSLKNFWGYFGKSVAKKRDAKAEARIDEDGDVARSKDARVTMKLWVKKDVARNDVQVKEPEFMLAPGACQRLQKLDPL